MRDYPGVPNVFRINSSSNIYDVEQYQRMLKASTTKDTHRNTNINGGRNYDHSYHNSASKKNNYGENDDESSIDSQPNKQPGSTNCYTLLDAITSAVTGGTCGGAVHPVHDDSNSEKQSVHKTRTDDRHFGQRTSLTQSASISPYSYGNDNYRKSYLLWIVTPVAAR